ncbi:uncharacterized protein LOC143264091 [Megachile rotundata]|uniref:uncharacterized protein LOC143264091 n=1 Tax=Megachile rotundata TaxID=143995 RepID=UPI003FD22D37
MSKKIEELNDFAVAELKCLLRARNLKSSGAKAELLTRLQTAVPDWEDQIPAFVEELRVQLDAPSERNTTLEQDEAILDQDDCSGGDVVEDSRISARELDLLRREKELLERELRLLRSEREVHTPRSDASEFSARGVNVRHVAEMLNEFSGEGDSFANWQQQATLLRETYILDENSMRLRNLFDHRPKKLELRRKLEDRVWKKTESFADYFYDKLTLAEDVQVDEEELIDVIIDGVSDVELRNQARMHCFSSTDQILKAFSKLTLDPSKVDRERKEVQNTAARADESSGHRRAELRCYNCNKVGHRRIDCQQPLRDWGSCFRCGSRTHRIGNCPRNQQTPVATHTFPAAASSTRGSSSTAARGSAASATTNLVQPTSPHSAFMVPMQFTLDRQDGSTCNYNISAMIDSGSPVSLIKSSLIPAEFRNCYNNAESLSGINGSPLRVEAIFESRVKIENSTFVLRFLVVPDDTMFYTAILGRDYLLNPSITVTLGKKFEIQKTNREERDNHIEQILQINYMDHPTTTVENININPELSHLSSSIEKLCIESSENIVRDGAETSPIEMTIELKSSQPVSYRPRRFSFADKEKLRELLDTLLKENIIRPSNSPYASPIVLVRKKTGGVRLCIDYRELNKITIKNNYPTPLIDDHLDRLNNKKYFSKLDLRNGFHHVKMAENSIKYTSFVTPLGQFEYLRMPFGLTNAPRVFQKYLNDIFQTLIFNNEILLYLDDILIATSTIEEHLDILQKVFCLASKYKLQFRWDKCSFLYTRITYLGYLIDNYGIRPSKENIESVLCYPIPKSTKDVHRFVSLASYFRRFIRNFSIIAKPLYDMLRENSKFCFGTEELQAFETLKERLASEPVLAIYAPNLETELHCDASANGYGAILSQKQSDDIFKPVFYFSKRTSVPESKYHSFELECLAVVYAIKRFHIYLYGIPFTIVTDCDSFRLTLSKQSVNPRIYRWALFLENYEYKIVHRASSKMGHVDALSRCHGIHTLETNNFDRIMSLKQMQDPKILEIRRRLEDSEDKLFELRDGLVYRKVKMNKLLFYVPECMETNVIRSGHDELGHIGADKVFEYVGRVYWFPKMRDKIKNHIQNCLRCIEFSPIEGKSEEFLDSEGVDHILIAVGTPQANGQIERYNRVIAPMIAKLATAPNKWCLTLKSVEYTLNNTLCKSTGSTPSKLLFGLNQTGQVSDNVRAILETYSEDNRNLEEVRSVA